MKKFFLLMMLMCIISQLSTMAQTSADNQEFAAYEILLELEGSMDKSQVKVFLEENNLVIRKTFKYLPNTFVVRVKGKENMAKEIADSEQEKQIVIDLIQVLRQKTEVVNVEPNFKVEVNTQEVLETSVPNDPDYLLSWGLDKISAPQAWSRASSSSFKIGVIDTGVDIEHEDLKDNIWTNPYEQAGDANNDGFPGIMGVDDDGDGLIDEDSQGLEPGQAGYLNDLANDDDENGYNDDFHGWNFTSNNNDVTPYHAHGTHCSGIIGAIGGNGIGSSGVLWDVEIVSMPIMLSPFNPTLLSDILEAFEYAKMNNIRILSNSWFTANDSKIMYKLMSYLGQEEDGILFVFAAGNAKMDNDLTPTFPNAYDIDNIIVVAATDIDDNLAVFSNYGLQSVDIAAPGVNIFSSYWTSDGENNYAYASGTSMAAPFVAAAAGLVWTQIPEKSWQDVKSILLSGIDYIPELSDKILTGGRLNLNKTLDLTESENQPPVVDAGPSVIIPRDSLTVMLEGTAVDSTLLPGVPLYAVWKKETGPGEVTFANHSSTTTQVWFSEPGRYTLRLSATDGEYLGSDLVVVHISAFEPIADLFYQDFFTYSICTENNYLYANLINVPTSAMKIYDISNPENPVERGTLTDNTGLLLANDIEGDYAYIGNNINGLMIVDVTDKDNPFVVSRFAVEGSISKIKVENNIAYLGMDGRGVAIIDVSDKSSPQLISEIINLNYSHAEFIRNNIYMSSDSTINIYDVSTPVNPILNRQLSFDNRINTFAVQEPYLLIAMEEELRTYYIENNNQIKIYSTNHANIREINLKGNLAICSDASKIQLYDISNKVSTKTIDAYGMYQQYFTAKSDDILFASSADQKRISILRISQINTAPYVYAGLNKSILLNDPLLLDAYVDDDGFPIEASVELTWAKNSGPGNVYFSDVNSASTIATFDHAGTYRLQLNSFDSEWLYMSSLEVNVIDSLGLKASPAEDAITQNIDDLGNKVSIFPNPTTSNTFSIDLGNHDLTKLSITSISGSVIYNTLLTEQVTSINLPDLLKGMYILYLENENGGVQVEKLIFK